MSIAERLHKAMQDVGVTGAELSRRSGVNPPTIHRILSGESASPRKPNIEKLAKALRVSQDWLFFGSARIAPYSQHLVPNSCESPPLPAQQSSVPFSSISGAARKYPVLSWDSAANTPASCNSYLADDAADCIESAVNAGDHGYWLAVNGPAMQPKFVTGMLLLVKPEGFDLLNGKFYIARLKSTGETIFKQYLRDSGSNFLQSLNPSFPIIPITDDIEIIGRVMAAQHPADDF